MAATVAMMTAIAIVTVEIVIVEVVAIVNMFTPNYAINLVYIICIESSILSCKINYVKINAFF